MSTNPRRPEDLGSMGESFFKLLAKDAGLVVNASDDDKAGWDFDVEHPSPLIVNYSSQSRPLYRVQVKSTYGVTPTSAISYSSLLSLIQFSGPAFLFLVCFDDKIMPIRAHLLHITESLAMSILRSLRKREVRAPGFKLNTSKITITFGDESRLATLNGECLRRMFEVSVSVAYLEYVKTKAQWLQAIERDSTLWHFNVRLENEEAMVGMANCFLGYEQPFNVTSVSYFAPLGIAGEIPEHPQAFAPTTIKPLEEELEKAVVRLARSEYGPKHAFSATIYTVPKQLPAKFAAMRIKTALFSIVFRLENTELTFHGEDLFNTELKAPVRELHGFLSHLKDTRDQGTTHLEVESLKGGPSLKLSLGPSAVAVSEDFDKIYAAFDATYWKLTSLGLIDEVIRPSLMFVKFGHFHLLQIVGKTYAPDYVLDFAWDAKVDASTDVVIFNSSIELESKTVVSHAAFFGSVVRLDAHTVRGRFTRSELLGQLIIPNGADVSAIQKEQEERLEQDLRKRGFSVL